MFEWEISVDFYNVIFNKITHVKRLICVPWLILVNQYNVRLNESGWDYDDSDMLFSCW